MHIKIEKSEKPQTSNRPLTREAIAQAVADYLATGGAVYVCPPTRKR